MKVLLLAILWLHASNILAEDNLEGESLEPEAKSSIEEEASEFDTTVPREESSVSLMGDAPTSETKVGVNGKPIPKLFQDLEGEDKTGLESINYSIGFGFQYFFKNHAVALAEIEAMLFEPIALGLQVSSLGNMGFTQDRSAFQILGSLNIHANKSFTGLWIQAAAGTTILKESTDTSTSIITTTTFAPTLMGTIGWRWKFLSLEGKDDEFTFSITAGVQTWLGNIRWGNLNTSGIYPLPIARLEMHFGL